MRYDVLVPFTIADPFGNVQCAGNLQNRVVKSKLTGEYHFYYRIRNTWGVGGIGGIATSSFGDVSHFVAFRIDGLGTVHPLFVRHTPVPGEIEFSGLNVDCRKHQESQFILIKRPWTTTAYAGGVTRIFSSNGYEVSVPTVQP
ncbi:hypothetical protein [Methylocystis sp. B8]|uniref:hypothetical protein n=1 Tax=Methylocystis sp. B8 TaxID=544938 RepID=UPI0010FD7EEC|nr:hypothetical protein [Methylocystis sp. B8]TLG77817.1 hypothetical protein FEV16_08335 [Methylocystis sp. B8]